MLDFMNMKPEKKKFKCSIITQAYRSRCSSRESSSKARIAEDFSTILRIQQGEILIITDFLLSFNFLSSGAFLIEKKKKHAGHPRIINES